MIDSTENSAQADKRRPSPWVFDLLLLVVLLAGAFLRVTGIFWGEDTYPHPDERFLLMVGSSISPVKSPFAACEKARIPADGQAGEEGVWLSLGEYFDTANSPLNPHNCGHGLYVYGTFPMFLTRFAVEWIYGHSGLTEMLEVGRPLSALVDLLVVFLVYLTAARLYDRRVGLLAAAFSALAVLQIQQAHFFTMDTFVNLFALLAFYFAVRILVDERAWSTVRVRETAGAEVDYREEVPSRSYGITHQSLSFDRLSGFTSHPLLLNSLGFGLAFGLAMASKVNAAPLAIVLPAAVFLRMWRLPSEEREKQVLKAIAYLALAGLASFLVFRILQPYAFTGPGFFGLRLNPQWVANLRELRMLTSGDVDFPPAMQWARRPVWFSARNMVMWGLGLPLGLLAWAGFLWAGWRMLARQGNWQHHTLIWGWTGLYFTWQSLSSNPTMRYQLIIYPLLAIFAGWALVALYDRGRNREAPALETGALAARRRPWPQVLAVVTGSFVLLATFAWAFAFTTTVYGKPFTRAAASRWMFQNIPGPINLQIQTGGGLYSQPVPFPYSASILPGSPYTTSFTPKESGEMAEIAVPHLINEQGGTAEQMLTLTVTGQAGGDGPLGTATITGILPDRLMPLEPGYTFRFDEPIALTAGQSYGLRVELHGEPQSLDLNSPIDLLISTLDTEGAGSPVTHSLEIPASRLAPGLPFSTDFLSEWDGTLSGLFLAGLDVPEGMTEPVSLEVRAVVPGEAAAFDSSIPMEEMGGAIVVAMSPVYPDEIGEGGLLIPLDVPVPLIQGQTYTLVFTLYGSSGPVKLQGTAVANEGEWDDPLPLRIDGYDAFGGIYPLDLNLNMYWDDNPEKLARFQRILDQSEYVVISSSRQWGSLPRIPERFPMTTVYYRNLIGCPDEYTIETCYNIAEPGTFRGRLGYELVRIFHANPSIGPLEINDQPSEEAFTVYDHPKVFIFKKTADYDPQKVAGILGSVDFSQIIRLPPLRYGSQPANLMLPVDRLAEQRRHGTWSELFDTQALQNRFPALSVVLWYVSVFALGLMAYPLLRWLLPGLNDHGYPLARTAGLLILAYGVWLAGSLRVPFSRLTITVAVALLAVLAGYLAYRQRAELGEEWCSRRRYFLTVEGLFLAFFVLDLLIRMGNPDLWHPWKGGEKPMDFAYFNAVLKSTTFPPYDPWFAGGYLNYYYFGFVFAGVLVKWLGIVPAVAYNLVIPTIFAMIALGAFSLAWNLSARLLPEAHDGNGIGGDRRRLLRIPWFTGLAGALGMAVLGNLGTVKMIYEGYKRLGAPGGVTDAGGTLTHWVWAIRGFFQVLSGAQLPYSLGDWYWLPSRAIPAPNDVEPITEFPSFTVLYADLHAHLVALPITLLALAWVLSAVFSRGRWRSLSAGLFSFLFGGIVIGALRPTNTWDFYPYLALAAVGIAYAFWFGRPWNPAGSRLNFLERLPEGSRRILRIAGGVVLLAGLSFVLYQPYANWYGLGYGEIELWRGTRTPLLAYLVHWGLFLFVILAWMAWETREWMANTPVSALNKLRPYRGLIWGAAGLLVLAIVVLLILGVRIAWFVLPLAAWAGVLLLRPDKTDARRFVLFLIGTGLVLTLMVEVIVLRGDIGRMNTVFKFYLQVWTFFAISAAAAFGWLLVALPRWLPNWRSIFQIGLTVLVAGAALFPLLGGIAKVKDRMIQDGPVTLDGMAYMQTAEYTDTWGSMDLSQDYRAIRWLQENVDGSPVIVEANLRDLYRWGSRFSIYTGLPGVVGWEWHQQQQRAVVPGTWISSRIAEIETFYTTTDLGEASDFLRKYDVQYIILGQQERGKYPGPGLDKFPAAEGALWTEVFRDADTVIYRVIQENLS